RLASYRPDALYQRHNVFMTSAMRAARKLRIPVILEVNAPVFYESENDFYLRFLHKRSEIAAFRMADVIIVVSERVKDILTDVGIGGKKIHVIPNAVDAEEFSPAINGGAIRERHNLQKKVVVGFIGSFKPWHGIENLLNCIARVKQKGVKNLHYLLVGEGPLKEYARRYLKEHDLTGEVTLTGKIGYKDVPRYLASMDILISPHNPQEVDKDKFHGSPIKIFEYMSMARPIIASKVGQIGEILEEGKSALLMEPGDEEAMCDAIVELSGDKRMRDRLGKCARETVLSSHTWEQNASRVIDIVEQLQ
ncbi:MAG: glycosyltransferase family 4 protein, partial [Deltaproteobacteria bacterium]|nr:glycosyltransferase family 4 protein [Deltaproteobacteria bacterium]